jgi:hypothetical protein
MPYSNPYTLPLGQNEDTNVALLLVRQDRKLISALVGATVGATALTALLGKSRGRAAIGAAIGAATFGFVAAFAAEKMLSVG